MILKINGIVQNLSDFDGTENFSFVFRRGAENSYSPELVATGDAFNYLYSQLIDQPNPSLTSVTVDVFDDCCQTDSGNDVHLFTGLIRGSDVSWCEYPTCEITITVVDNSEDAQIVACLKNTFPWDRINKFGTLTVSDGEDTARTAPFLVYCADMRPAFLQEIIFIFGILFLFALAPLIAAVSLILVIVGAIPNFTFFFAELEQLITGCGFKHKTPFIHSYLKNICDICGANLSSSFFDVGGVYHNTMRLDAGYKAGKKNDSRVLESFEKNKPNINGVQFLDSLKELNFDWRVQGSALIVERKDDLGAGVWIDLTTIDSDDILELCFDPVEDLPPAFAEYLYTKDGIDNTGDETNPDWVERAIDWNIPVNPSQSGLFTKRFPYSTAQFRDDSGRDGVSALDKPFYKSALIELNQFDGVMLMEKGICLTPRLLMWDGTSPQDDARVKRYPSQVADTFDYNVDWWVKLNYIDGSGTARNTLYQRTLSIDDPRVSGVKIRPYTVTISVLNVCDYVKGLDISVSNKLDKIIRVPYGGNVYDGSINEIEYSVTQNTIRISGKI
jgi:hypothetical protein